ncbi:MAG: hypothetical protein JNK72_12655 [Myxococcales bacterium]|nr:hypothetical protein [Myxococcales bacterium]
MANRRRFFRAAGYLFTYGLSPAASEVGLEMYREDTATGERFFLTRTKCGPEREAAYARAMALVAWVKSLSVPRRREPKAQAVLEQLAIVNDRMARMARPRDLSMAVAVDQLLEGRITAAA